MSLRSVLQRKLLEVEQDLLAMDCQFFACPGEDEPFKDMATCRRCSCIKAVRSMLQDLDEN